MLNECCKECQHVPSISRHQEEETRLKRAVWCYPVAGHWHPLMPSRTLISSGNRNHDMLICTRQGNGPGQNSTSFLVFAWWSLQMRAMQLDLTSDSFHGPIKCEMPKSSHSRRTDCLRVEKPKSSTLHARSIPKWNMLGLQIRSRIYPANSSGPLVAGCSFCSLLKEFWFCCNIAIRDYLKYYVSYRLGRLKP